VSEVAATLNLLAEYAAVWRDLGSRQELRLRAGLPSDSIKEALHGEGLPSPAEVQAWFSWHDGYEPPKRVTLAPTFYAPLPLERSLEDRKDLLGHAIEAARTGLAADGSDQPEFWWRPEWLPFAQTRGGEYLAFDLRVGHSAAPIRAWAPDDPDSAQQPSSPSLSVMIGYWSDALRAGGRWVGDTSSGRWELDETRFPPLPEGLSRLAI
jgi:hypothetical protein